MGKIIKYDSFTTNIEENLSMGDDVSKAMKVGELIKLLKEFDQNLPVGSTGHYGEFYLMDEHNFSINYDSSKGWDKRIEKWLQISCPNIGEEPD